MQEYSKLHSSTTESWLELLKLGMCRLKISLISCPRTYIFTGIKLAPKKLELQTCELSATIERTSADEQDGVEEHNLQNLEITVYNV